MLLGGQGQIGAPQQSANALGPIELVAAQRQQIDADIGHGQGNVADGLGGIAMEEHAALAAEGGDGGQGLQHADFIVGRHHRQQQGGGAEGRR